MSTEQTGRKMEQHEDALIYDTKAYSGSSVTFLLIINLGYMEEHCRHHAPTALPPVKKKTSVRIE